MMIVLGIETSGPVGSVAVCRDESVLASYNLPEGARHARDIVPAVNRVLCEGGIERGAVSAVAVSEGPGSFTGLRVGVTCAKALFYALGWSAIGVPSLHVLAENVPAPGVGDSGYCCPVRDARRGRVYGTCFGWDEGAWGPLSEVRLETPEDLADSLPDGTIVFGTGVRAYSKVFAPERFTIGPRDLEIGRAEAVARLGARMLQVGRQPDNMALEPRYYRLTAPEERESGRGN